MNCPACNANVTVTFQTDAEKVGDELLVRTFPEVRGPHSCKDTAPVISVEDPENPVPPTPAGTE